VSNLPISSKYRTTPEHPVDEGEREDLTTRLNDAYTRGSVDPDRYRELLDRLYAARTLGELVPAVEALPARATHDQPALARQETTLAPAELSPAGMGPQASRMVATALGAGGLLVIVLLVLAVLL